MILLVYGQSTGGDVGRQASPKNFWRLERGWYPFDSAIASPPQRNLQATPIFRRIGLLRLI
jgi:hypothetical protein